MNEENKFNLYEDDVRKDPNLPEQSPGNLVSDSVVVYLNFNDELPNLIKPIREALQDKPDHFELNIYIVSGFQINPDIPLFLNYIGSIEEDFDFTFFIRGIIHPDFISILFKEDVFVEKGSRLVYRQDTLHQLLTQLMIKPDIFRKFMQRFIDQYHKFPKYDVIDITELETIGFKINKF